MDLTSFYSQFRDETVENIRTLTNGLIALEGMPTDAPERRQFLDEIFRAMHTIKGSARVLGFEHIGQIAHTCEHILGAVREGRRELDRALADDLLRGGDAILELAQALVEGRSTNVDVEALTLALGRGKRQEAGQESAPASGMTVTTTDAPSDAPAGASRQIANSVANSRGRNARQTIRVRVDRLDRLLNLAGELAIAQQSQSMHVQALEELKMLLARQQRALVALEAEIAHLRLLAGQREAINGHLNEALNTGDHAGKIIRTQIEQFTSQADQHAQLVEDLEQEVMAVRLLPVSTLFAHLPRAVRELAHAAEKDIALVLQGESTELDRKIIEALSDPLVHLVRNAADHGIEPPAEREEHGKPPQGTLTVHALALGSYVHITVSDDGRGMDPQRLRQSAVQKGLMSEEAAARLSDQEALELIFLPGFTTARMITDISGRGVGMDIVRTNIMDIGGQVLLESSVGVGTAITLVLPLTLVTTQVLLVEAADQIFALPASGCLGSLLTTLDDITTIEGHAMIAHESHLVPLYQLADLLALKQVAARPRGRRLPTVLVGSAQRPSAIMVDRLMDEREVVVKSLGPLLECQRHYGGAVQLGDGTLALLLNPSALTHLARGITVGPTAPRNQTTQKRAHLLVADDSFTTRELIRTILQSVGYDVTTATDGLDALNKVRDGRYDLVVSDIEMPRMDGFTLTECIRKEIGRADLPVIIVTSLASEKHHRRGLEVGAQAYIVKSQFNQGNLLETVRQLLGQ